jgi:hypothetical protein
MVLTDSPTVPAQSADELRTARFRQAIDIVATADAANFSIGLVMLLDPSKPARSRSGIVIGDRNEVRRHVRQSDIECGYDARSLYVKYGYWECRRKR